MAGMVGRAIYRVNPQPIVAGIQNQISSRLGDIDPTRGLYADWMRYDALVFRGIPTNNAQHLALSRCLGEYMVDLCRGSMLRMLERPEEDEVTLFFDTAAAYDVLAEDWTRPIAGLQVRATPRLDFRETTLGVNWSGIRWSTEEATPGSRGAMPNDMCARYLSVVHRMMIERPEPGKKWLSISPTYFAHVLCVSDEQSDQILSFIVAHTLKLDVFYTHDRAASELILWDDRRMMHAAASHPPRYRRACYARRGRVRRRAGTSMIPRRSRRRRRWPIDGAVWRPADRPPRLVRIKRTTGRGASGRAVLADYDLITIGGSDVVTIVTDAVAKGGLIGRTVAATSVQREGVAA